ncbi:MAG: 5-(carboxyamino)imidazole ribonucleotide mutase [Clostridia bacterium]
MLKKVAIIMGSDSDYPRLKGAFKILKEFGIEVESHVMSAHRTPEAAATFAKNAKENGIGVIIAAAGKAAHLAGVIAAHTTLPVIGIPVDASLGGLDALLATVQMPNGIPVATVSINSGENAALLAVQMMGIDNESISDKLLLYKEKMVSEVERKDSALQDIIASQE